MDTHHDIRDGVEDATNLDPKYRLHLKGAIDFLLEDPEVERGVLIRNDLTWVPFQNIIPAPNNQSLIRMDTESFQLMGRMMSDKNFYGWLHSHPKWVAQPSSTDIEYHQFPGNMLIYSIVTDTLNEFTTSYIDMLENMYNKRKQQGKAI
jgi:proteasome lid subunit RPN8/RPN11